ncbi:putative defense protein 3 [Brevipalpus obovatus]|uniref:putative defense protein 3 n=1 Tax=Brevipalpus obovatus TaxID=246614 RepID=UPI003D9F4FEE
MKNLGPLILAILATLLFASVYGSPNGAPPKACSDLKPGHEEGKYETKLANPCSLSAEEQSDGSYKIILSASPPNYFRGFLLAVKSGSKYLGTWSAVKDAKNLACPKGDSITHKDKNKKTSVTFTWIPAPGDAGKAKKLEGACVKDFETFWQLQHALN